MSEIDQQKLELLRTALSKGLSAGDGGLTEPRGELSQVASFPQFSSKVTESKTYSPDVSIPPVPQISQDSAVANNLLCGLALYTKTESVPTLNEDGEDTGFSEDTKQVWIGAGTVAGQIPSGFDPEEGKVIASEGSGNVWAELNIDQETGEIVSIAVTGGSETPTNTNTAYYYTLGYYEYDGDSPSVINYGCGSLQVTICRNWFAAVSPFYGVSISRE